MLHVRRANEHRQLAGRRYGQQVSRRVADGPRLWIVRADDIQSRNAAFRRGAVHDRLAVSGEARREDGFGSKGALRERHAIECIALTGTANESSDTLRTRRSHSEG